MNDRQAFLRAIIEQPGEDHLRLIFADWLQENGEPERAEFIRVQIAMVQCWAGHDGKDELPVPLQHRYSALGRRERELLDTYWEQFRVCGASKIGWRHACVFRRGFVEEITCPWADFTAHAAAIRAATPLRKVRLTDRPPPLDFRRTTHPDLFTHLDYPGIEFELLSARPVTEAIREGMESMQRSVAIQDLLTRLP